MVSSQSRTCCFRSVSWMSSCFEVVRKSSTFFWTSSSQRRDTGMAAASVSESSPGSVEVICCSRVFGGVLPAVFLHRLRRWRPWRWRCPAAFLLCSFWSVSICSLTCFRHRTSTAAEEGPFRQGLLLSAWPAQAAGYHWWKPCSLTAPFLLASVLAPPPRWGHGVGPRFPEGLRSRESKGSRPCPGPGVSFSQDVGSKASSRSGSGKRPALGSGARWGPQGLRPRRAARAALHSLQPLPQPRFRAPGPLERRLGDAERRAGTPTRREAHGLLLDPPGLCCSLAAVPP